MRRKVGRFVKDAGGKVNDEYEKKILVKKKYGILKGLFSFN